MADPYRVLVTGSRAWTDKDFIWDVLNGMVAELQNMCFAFIRNGSHGATHCADLAEREGIHTLRYTRDKSMADAFIEGLEHGQDEGGSQP